MIFEIFAGMQGVCASGWFELGSSTAWSRQEQQTQVGRLWKIMLLEDSMFFVFFFSLFRKTLAELEIDGAILKREVVVTPLSLPQPLDHLDQLSLEKSRES